MGGLGVGLSLPPDQLWFERLAGMITSASNGSWRRQRSWRSGQPAIVIPVILVIPSCYLDAASLDVSASTWTRLACGKVLVDQLKRRLQRGLPFGYSFVIV